MRERLRLPGAGPPGERAASLGLVLGGALWGLIWLPLRALGEAGLSGAWAGAMLFAGTAVVLSPLILRNRRRFWARRRALLVCGLLTGAAFSFYSTAVLLTEVVRAVLLFYLTPVWGTLLGLVVLGERPGAARWLALALALGGLVALLGEGGGWPLPRTVGDWMALAAGFFWAFGSLALYRAGGLGVVDECAAFALGALAVSVLTLALGGPALAGAVPLDRLVALAPWGIAAALYMGPTLVLTIWPATVLTPGRVGLLLMSEVVVGVGSAALLAGEPFGRPEALGSLLIVSAAATEVLGRRRVR